MEKDFAWLCAVLSAFGAQIFVPETVFFEKDEIDMWVFTTKEGVITKKSILDESNRSAASVLQYFSQIQTLPSTLLCTAMVKSIRLQVTPDRFEEAAALKGPFTRCSFFQQSIYLRSAPAMYLVRVELQGKEYQTYFLVRRNGEKECGDLRLYCKFTVYVKVVLRAVESVKRRRVEELGMEFGVGDEGRVWLVGCWGCRLGPSTTNTKPHRDKKREKDPPKGPLEGETTAIATISSPLPRLSTPIQFRFPSNPSVPQFPPNDPSVPVLNADPRPSLPPPTPQSQSTSKFSRFTVKRPANFYDSNFKEVLARTWARSKRWLSEDYECIFLDLDTNVLKDDEPLPKLKRSGTLLRYSDLSASHGKTQEGKESEGKLHIDTEKSALLRRSESLATSGHNSPLKPVPPMRTKRLKHHPTKSLSSVEKILALYATPRSLPRFPLKPLSTRYRKDHSLPNKTPKSLGTRR
jgi:hypothetical protein